MKITTLTKVSAFLLVLLVFGGCTDGFDSLKPQGHMALKLVAVDLEGGPTKAAPNEDTITHLWVLQFDGTGDAATFRSKTEYTSPNADNLLLKDLTPGINQTLVFVGNLNIEKVKNFDSGTLATFKALSLPVTSEESLFPMSGYIPMLGTWTGAIISNAEGDIPIAATIPMQRTVAKLSFTLQSGLKSGDSFKATSIRLYRVPNEMRLAETDPAVLYPAAGFTSVTGNYGSVVGGDLPKTVTWYMPENRRGTGTATFTSDKNETTAQSGQGASTTYIEVLGNYVTGGTTRVVRYRVWPGSNSTNDYNLRRNSSYALITTLKDMTTSSNRVEVYGEAYTGITEPDENGNNINDVPFLENLHSVKQSAKTEATATTRLIVDGATAIVSARGFVYSTTAKTEETLLLGKGGVVAAQESGSYPSGVYSKALTELALSTIYYIRAFATNSNGTGYSDIFTYTTPRLEPAANCFMVIPGETVMFEPKDALGTAKAITSASLLWQTRDDGTAAAAGNLAISAAADVVYDATGKVIIVRTNPACSAANAVIQGTGSTTWTWHVWVTPYRPQAAEGNANLQNINVNVAVPLGRVQTYDTKYQTAVVKGKGIMGRNLGSQATSILLDPVQVVNDPAFHFGMLYQWGLHMPWTPTTKESTTAAVPVFKFDASPFTQTGFATTAGSWGAAKTATDPCPAGWRVPPAGVFDDFANYGVFPGYNGASNAAGRMYIQGAVNAWYFCSGARTGDGSFVEVNTNGYTWTATAADGTNAKALKFDNVDGITGVVTPQASVSKIYALPVRCVQQ